MPTLGARVKALRVSARLSQPALAKLVGISQSAISQIEQGHTQTLRGEVLAGLCAHLHVSPDYLLGTKHAAKMTEPSEFEGEALLLFRKLDRDRQADAILMLRGLASAPPKAQPAPNSATTALPAHKTTA